MWWRHAVVVKNSTGRSRFRIVTSALGWFPLSSQYQCITLSGQWPIVLRWILEASILLSLWDRSYPNWGFSWFFPALLANDKTVTPVLIFYESLSLDYALMAPQYDNFESVIYLFNKLLKSRVNNNYWKTRVNKNY